MKIIQKYFGLFAFILIAGAALVAYHNTFDAEFQFDDGAHIQENERIQNFNRYTSKSHWKNINNRPLAHYTIALNYKWGEFDVTGYHIFNLLVHILAGLFAYLLTFQILSLRFFRKYHLEKNKHWAALFVALIYVTHPIQTQGVTYIIQRMTSMAAMFYLLSVFLYVKGRNIQVEKEKFIPGLLLIVAATVAGALGFISKQNAVTFPAAWLLTELFFIRDKNGKPYVKYLIGAGIALVAFVAVGIYKVGIPKEIEQITREEYAITQLRVMMKYAQLLVLPINQNIDYFYPFSRDFNSPKEWYGLAFNIVMLAGAILLYKKYRLLSYGIFWYYLTHSVESSIIPIRDAIFEHRLYLPMYGFTLIVVDLAYRFIGRKKAAYAAYFLTALTIVYIGATINRNNVWKTKKSLWTDAVEKAPKRERAWYWLASAYMDENDKKTALKCYNESIKNNPGFSMAYNARGNVKKDLKDLEGALKDYNKAINLRPNYGKAFYNRGILKAKMKDYKKAIADYNKAEKYGFSSSGVYYNRANSKMRSKQYKSAITDYNKCLKIAPTYSLAHYNQGLTYAKMKDHKKAVECIDRAIKFDNKNQLFYNGRGVSNISLEKYNDAVADFSKAIKLKPTNGQAYYNRGYAKHYGLKQTEAACKDWDLAIKYNYKSAESLKKRYCK